MGTIFTMDGITFGLAVCRDHLIGRLANGREKGKVQIVTGGTTASGQIVLFAATEIPYPGVNHGNVGALSGRR